MTQLTDLSLEEQIQTVSEMSREGCIESLLDFEEITLDFNREYLEGMALGRLQHVLVAALITANQHEMPMRRAG